MPNKIMYLFLTFNNFLLGPVALEYVWDWPETIPTRTIQRKSLFIRISGLLCDFVNIS